MMTTRSLLAGATSAALVALAACGDDPEPLSKDEFVEQADAICAATNTEVEPLWTAFWEGLDSDADSDTGESVFPSFDALLDDLTPIYEEQLDELRDLAPPADDAEMIDGLLDDFEAGLGEMNEIADSAVAGDEQARETMSSEDGDPMAEVNRAAREYGLVVCGAES